MYFKINPELLPIKCHYLFFYAGLGPMILFMPTYAKELGFSSLLVGIVYLIIPVLGLVAKLLVAGVADRYDCHKYVVIFLTIISMCSCFALQFVLQPVDDIGGTFTCADKSLITICYSDMEADRCLTRRLEGQHAEDLIQCKVACSPPAIFLEEMCNSWEFRDYCTVWNELQYRYGTVKNYHGDNMIESKLNETWNWASYKDRAEIQFKTDLRRSNIILTEDYYLGRICLSLDVDRVLNMNSTTIKQMPKCFNYYNLDCRLNCDVFSQMNFNVNNLAVPDIRFWTFLLLMVLATIGLVPVTSIGDTICFSLIGTSATDYGSQRLWGSVGWGFSALVSGLLIDRFNSSYVPVFYMVAFFLACDIICVSLLKDMKHGRSETFVSDISRLCLDVRIIVFVLWCTAAGLFNGLIVNFLFWYLEDAADCGAVESIKTLEGMYIFVQGFGGEIPFFYLNEYLVKTLGRINCMSLVLFAFGIKCFAYSVLINPWWLLPVGLLNGITFSTLYATMASQATAVASPGTEATVLAIVSASYEGFGTPLGSFLAGVLLAYFDELKVFQLYGFAAIGICALHMIVQNTLERNKN